MEHDGALQILGDAFAAPEVVLDELDAVVRLQRLGQPRTDVAAAGDDEPLVGRIEPSQLAHHGADVRRRSDEEHLVVDLDAGVALGLDGVILTIDGGHARLDVRHVLLERAQLLTDQRPAMEGAHRHHPDAPAGEVEHLERARILDQTQDVIRDQRLGTDGDIDRQGFGAEEFGLIEKALGAHPRDLGRRMEQRVGHLTGDHVGLVAVGDGDDHVGVLGAGAREHIGVCAMTLHRAQIEAILQVAQQIGVLIDHGDVVGLADQIGRDRGADLTGAQDDDLHPLPTPQRRSLISIPSERSLR